VSNSITRISMHSRGVHIHRISSGKDDVLALVESYYHCGVGVDSLRRRYK